MNKIIFSIFFFAVVLILSAGNIFACTCMHLAGTVEEGYKGRDAIFSGKVISIVKTSQMSRKVTTMVENSWKGKASETIMVSTAALSSMCGYTFVKGKSYLIYAYGKRDDLTTNICSRTSLLSDAEEDVKVLNELSAKKTSTKFSPK